MRFRALAAMTLILVGCQGSDQPSARERRSIDSSATSSADSVTGVGASATPGVATSVLDVPNAPQLKSRWCWAATGEMISHYFDPSATLEQCEIVNRRYPDKGGRCCLAPLDPDACNFIGYPPFAKIGLSATEVDSPLSFDELIDEINNRRPIAVAWNGLNGKDGHMGLLIGYVQEATGGKQLWLNDPLPSGGDAGLIAYGEYLNHPQYGPHRLDYYHIHKM